MALVAFTASAQMVTNTVTYSASWNTNNPSEFSVYLSKLATNLSFFGQVLSIQVGIYVTNTFNVWAENDNIGAGDFNIQSAGQTIATNPGPTDVLMAFSGTLATTNLAGSDGINGSGPDFAQRTDLQGTDYESQIVTEAFHSLYLGSGSFTVDINAGAEFYVSGNGDFRSQISNNRTSGSAFVIYTYTLIPEPGVWGGLAAAAALALVVRARRRRAS